MKAHTIWDAKSEDDSGIEMSCVVKEFPLRVTPPDRSRLLEICDDLEQQIENGQDVNTNIKAIMTMPQYIALPAWRELAKLPSIISQKHGEFIGGLQSIGTKETVAIMAEFWDREQPGPERQIGLRWNLLSMYRSVKPDVKAYIRRLFIEREGVMPEIPKFGKT